MKNIDVSIISVNFNNSILTLDFIQSVIEHTPSSIGIEFIIVDNCSSVKEYELLLTLLSDLNYNVTLLKSNINLGFGGGNMLGTQKANGKYLAYINNDIVFTEDCFSSLINFFSKNPVSGVCTPQQYNIQNTPVSCFDYFHGIRKELLGRKLVEITSRHPKRRSEHYTENLSVDFIQGCFMFFRANVFSEVGGFDTNLFLYYEEMDICYRIKKIGFTSNLVPETSFKHLHKASTSTNSSIQKEFKISKLYISRKNHWYVKHFFLKTLMFIKIIFKPKYWSIGIAIITGKYLENSLKQKQTIRF
ncbi:glycosyltransferase family 2 protein [Wenyingzhuangia sp. IMCC45533]